MVIKTLLCVNPEVVHSYQACRPGVTADNDTCSFFEILGFDILLDRCLRPWLLEVKHRVTLYDITCHHVTSHHYVLTTSSMQVNRSPSFNTDSQLDLDIKSGVIHDALRLVNVQ